MKRFLLPFFLTLSLFSAKAQQTSVSIGTEETKTNAILWLKGSGSQGLVLPVVTNHSNITVDADDAGMIVYNNTQNKVFYYNGSGWLEIGSGGSTGSGNVQISVLGNQIQVVGSSATPATLAVAQPTTAGQLLMWNGTSWTSNATSAPSEGQVLKWNSTSGSWAPSTDVSSGTPNVDNQTIVLESGVLQVGPLSIGTEHVNVIDGGKISVERNNQSVSLQTALDQMDGSDTNEIQTLSVTGGNGTAAVGESFQVNISPATSTPVTITEGSNIEIERNGNALTINASGAGPTNANAVSVTPIGNLTATDAQAALAELQSDIDGMDADETNEIQNLVVTGDGTAAVGESFNVGISVSNTSVTITEGNNIEIERNGNALTINASGAGSTNADAVSVSPSGNLTATDAQAAFEELQAENDIDQDGDPANEIQTLDVTGDGTAAIGESFVVNISTATTPVTITEGNNIEIERNGNELTIHGTTSTVSAIGVAVTPSGDLTSTNTQQALEELQTELTVVEQNAVQDLSILDTNAGETFSLGISNGTGLTIQEGANVDLSLTGSTLTVNASTAGEVNTASNLGTGQGVFNAKSGTDLQFNSIAGAGSGKISVTSDAVNNLVLIDVNENNLSVPPANVTHSATSNGDILQIVAGTPTWAPVASTVDQTAQTGVLIGDGSAINGLAGTTGNLYLRRNAANTDYEFGALSTDHIASGTLPIARGGTGATTAGDARTALGLQALATKSSVASADITDNTITASDLSSSIAISTSGNISTSGTLSSTGTSTNLTSTNVSINGGTTTIEGATFPPSAASTGVLLNDGAGTMSWSTIGGSQITNNSIDVSKLTSSGATDADKVFITNGSGTPGLQSKTTFLSGTLTSSSAAGGDATGTLSSLTLSTAAATGGRMVTAINNSTGVIDESKLDTDVITASETFSLGSVRGSFQTGLNIEDAAVTDAKIASGVSGSKINPSFTQNVHTTGDLSADGNVSATDLTLSGSTTIGGKTYSWPAGAGADASGVLTHDGSGGLTWSSATGIGEVVAGTGLTGGGTSSTVTISLSNTGVTANTYGTATQIPQLSVNSQGRITGVTNIPFTPGMADPMTATGDIVYNNASGDPTRLAIGAPGQVLMVNSGVPSWQNLAGGGTITGVTTGTGSGLQGGGTTGSLDVSLIDGTASGQILKWNGITNEWELGSDDTGAGGIATLSNGQVLIGDGTNNSAAGVGGDLSMSQVAGAANFQIQTNAVTTTELADNSITNADINTAADIDVTKLSGGAANQVLQTDAGGVPVWTTLSTGEIDDLSDVVLSAPSASQVMIYTSGNTFENKTITGDISINESGAATIAAGAISGGAGGKIADNSITVDDLANSSVTNAKIVGVNASKINGLTTSFVPRATASGLTNGLIRDDGSEVGINTAPVSGTTLSVLGGANGAAQFGGKVTVSGNLVAEGLEITKALMTNSDAGIAGQVLTSSGTATAPVWTTLPTSFTTNNILPKGDGSQMVASNIYDDGTYVGIGTTSPATELDIRPSGGNTTPRLRLKSSESTAGASAYLSIGRDDGLGNFLETGSIYDPGSSDGLRLASYNMIQFNVASANRFSILSNGEFAIGNSSAVGTAGQVLTSGGSGSAPSWTDLPSTFSTDNAIPVGNGSGMEASAISDNGSSVQISRPLIISGTSLVGSSNMTVHYTTSTASEYGGMYVNTTSNSRPFYGYAQAGSPVAWTYLDGNDGNKWKLNYTNTDRLTVTSTGNFGVGTTTPVNRLDVEGGIAVGATYSGTNAAPSNGAIVEGNVGIGTATAVNKLDVEGGVAIGQTYSGTTIAPTNGAIIEGNLGIGTSSPSTKLHLSKGTATGAGAYSPFVIGAIEDDARAYLEFNAASYAGITFNDDGQSVRSGMFFDYTSDDIMFRVGGSDNKLVIKEAGDVRIANGLSIGTGYLSNTPPSNGAIISGNVGIGTSVATYPLSLYTSTTARGVNIENDYAGADTQFGVTVDMTAATGSGTKYGIDVNVAGTASDNSIIYGLETDLTPNGTGTAYGVNTNMSAVGTGVRYGVYSTIYQATANTSNAYGFYSFINSPGTGSAWGVYTSGEDYNYFSGSVGIGTSTPDYTLHLAESQDEGFIVNMENTNSTATGADVLRLRIATTSPTTSSFYLGCYAGTSLRGGIRNDGSGGVSLYSASDRRLKENIADFDVNALSIISSIRTRKYNFIGFDKPKAGFIAQELLEVYPAAVAGDPNGDPEKEPLMINHDELTPVVIKAIQEQQQVIEQQQAEIQNLKALLAEKEKAATATQTELKNLSAEVVKIKEALGLEAKQTDNK